VTGIGLISINQKSKPEIFTEKEVLRDSLFSIMNYVVAILPDRLQAEAAYSALEEETLSIKQVSIVGKGYKDIDEYGFLDPAQIARRQAIFMSYWLVPFGFIAGYSFNLLTKFELFPWAGSLGNHLIGALFGAIAGAMGSFFVGGGADLVFGNRDFLPYRKYVKSGKYLIVVNGPPNLTNQATRILKQFEPENIQPYYIDPGNL
jgi:hypothetical protein